LAQLSHRSLLQRQLEIHLATYLRQVMQRSRNDMTKILGIVLIVVGIVGLAWGGFNYTTREKVVDIGPIHASRDKNHTVPLSPIAGAIALVGGIALVAVGKNN
jgi:drug/metabolite transporter (DMT)-like permease